MRDVTEEITQTLEWMVADMDFRRRQTGLDSDGQSPQWEMAKALLANLKAGKIECGVVQEGDGPC